MGDLPLNPIETWGKDHWSLLAYLETRIVETHKDAPGAGEIDRDHLRCNRHRHPHFVGARQALRFTKLPEDQQDRTDYVETTWKAEYGTRLKGFFRGDETTLTTNDTDKQLPEHDDWDCILDMEEEGLLDMISDINGFVMFCEQGFEIANQLRDHLARGGRFSNFEPIITKETSDG